MLNIIIVVIKEQLPPSPSPYNPHNLIHVWCGKLLLHRFRFAPIRSRVAGAGPRSSTGLGEWREWGPGGGDTIGGGGGVQLKLGLFRSWNRVYGTKHHDQLRNRPSSGFAMCARQELNNLNIGKEPGFKLFNSRPELNNLNKLNIGGGGGGPGRARVGGPGRARVGGPGTAQDLNYLNYLIPGPN